MNTEKKLHLSKTVKDGVCVQLRGSKICRASSRTKRPLGIYKNEERKVFLVIKDNAFERFQTYSPEGIQTKGPCLIESGIN